MTILAAFVLNAGLNFVIGLLVAGLLGPGGFGRYGVALAAAVVLNTVLFEWLRLCATRFYSDRSRAEEPGIRATLDLGYAAITLLLAGVMVASIALGFDLGFSPGLAAATAAAGIGMGLFDYGAALARAKFDDRAYARLTIVKNLAAFALMSGGASLGDPALVLAGSALASVIAVMTARRSVFDGLRWREAHRSCLGTFAGYALPLVAASVVYQLIPVLNRGVLVAASGFAEAGYFALAADVGLRLFMAIGSALDLLLFQIAVRTQERHGKSEAERQVGRNLATVAAVLLPFAAGFWAILPGFEALFVPAAFRGPFAAYAGLLIPGLFAYALIQYALNPVFQIAHRTRPVVLAALSALAVDAVGLAVLPGLMGPPGVAAAQLVGLASGLAVLAVTALRAGPLLVPWRDLAATALATALMLGAIWPLRAAAALIALPAQVLCGLILYAALAYALDIAGARDVVGQIIRKWRRLPTARIEPQSP